MQFDFASTGVLLVPPDGGSIVNYGQHKGLEVNIKRNSGTGVPNVLDM